MGASESESHGAHEGEASDLEAERIEDAFYSTEVTLGECVVCMDAWNSTAMVPCGHVLCSHCCTTLRNEARGAMKCPICRRAFEDTVHISFSDSHVIRVCCVPKCPTHTVAEVVTSSSDSSSVLSAKTKTATDTDIHSIAVPCGHLYCRNCADGFPRHSPKCFSERCTASIARMVRIYGVSLTHRHSDSISLETDEPIADTIKMKSAMDTLKSAFGTAAFSRFSPDIRRRHDDEEEEAEHELKSADGGSADLLLSHSGIGHTEGPFRSIAGRPLPSESPTILSTDMSTTISTDVPTTTECTDDSAVVRIWNCRFEHVVQTKCHSVNELEMFLFSERLLRTVANTAQFGLSDMSTTMVTQSQEFDLDTFDRRVHGELITAMLVSSDSLWSVETTTHSTADLQLKERMENALITDLADCKTRVKYARVLSSKLKNDEFATYQLKWVIRWQRAVSTLQRSSVLEVDLSQLCKLTRTAHSLMGYLCQKKATAMAKLRSAVGSGSKKAVVSSSAEDGGSVRSIGSRFIPTTMKDTMRMQNAAAFHYAKALCNMACTNCIKCLRIHKNLGC